MWYLEYQCLVVNIPKSGTYAILITYFFQITVKMLFAYVS